jgi:hypothetical protein
LTWCGATGGWQLRAAETPEDLYSADPRVEEAIERSILPS